MRDLTYHEIKQLIQKDMVDIYFGDDVATMALRMFDLQKKAADFKLKLDIDTMERAMRHIASELALGLKDYGTRDE